MSDKNSTENENLARARGWLAHAVKSGGDKYRHARGTFLAQPVISLPILLDESKSSDWEHRLTARAIALRIHSAALVAYAEEVLQGRGLPPPKNIKGKYTSSDLGKFIARIGPPIDPWLFEAIVKEERWQDEVQGGILFVAVTERSSPELLPMLRSIVVDDAAPTDLRTLAIMAAVRTGNPDVWEEAHKLAKRSDSPSDLRSAALYVLSERVERVPPGFQSTCESIVLDSTAPARLRERAVRVLALLEAQGSLPVLYQAAAHENDDDVLGALCVAFASLPDARSKTTITDIIQRTTSNDTKVVCEESLKDLDGELTNGGGQG